jgi:Tfp pilus assembly protein PilF
MIGDYQASLADIDKTLALEPRHFGALSGRGLVYAQLEEWDLALESFEAALQVHPKMTGARRNVEAIRRHLKEQEI